jgi:hypothetical protein
MISKLSSPPFTTLEKGRQWWMLTAALLVAAAISGPGAASSRTTTPGVVYVVPVTLTNTSIVIPKDKFSIGKYPRYPRGALIRYSITNHGSRAYIFKIWASTTAKLRPHGGHDTLLLNWSYRGRFVYETFYRGKPAGPRGYVTIF